MSLDAPDVHATALPDSLRIDGRSVRGDGKKFAVINPGTEHVVAEINGASAAQTEAAILAARRAYDSNVWSGLQLGARVEALRRLVDYLHSQKDRITDIVVREAGCPISSATMMAQVQGPLRHALEVMDFFEKMPEIEENPLPLAERAPARGGAVQSLRRYAPMGVVACISAYNVPFYINTWKVIPALVTGNCAVLRPSPLTPLSALIFGEAAEAAELAGRGTQCRGGGRRRRGGYAVYTSCRRHGRIHRLLARRQAVNGPGSSDDETAAVGTGRKVRTDLSA